jgi:hypothetical protein
VLGLPGVDVLRGRSTAGSDEERQLEELGVRVRRRPAEGDPLAGLGVRDRLSIVAALAGAGTAAAGGGNGATVTNDSGCVTSPFTISCWDVKLVTETTTIPSGNVSYLTNGTLQNTVSILLLGCTYTRTQPIHDHELVIDGESHMFSRRFTDITSFGCGSGPSRRAPSASRCTGPTASSSSSGPSSSARPTDAVEGVAVAGSPPLRFTP